ncbi:hypothetical protein V5O48_006237 [Marasmius crinis-equi]|uniref:Uncharacterized protein n=1 Tax=Marasmius crinis-equi TaxID=585013 RepID=A0ABR3FKM2_9AGAR
MQFRNDSNGTDDSPFGSPLNTPADEDAVITFDKLGERLMNECGDTFVDREKQPFVSDTSISTMISKPSIATIQHADSVTSPEEVPSLPDSTSSPLAIEHPVDLKQPSSATPAIEPSNSVASSSPEIDFNSHQRASSLYSLPNVPICISPAISQNNQLSRSMSTLSSTSLDGLMIKLKTPEKAEGNTEHELSEVSSEDKSPGKSSMDSGSLIDPTTLLMPAQILCFLPWSIAVGCALILFPKHLEHVVFSSGYYYANAPSPRGIHRFAHLAEYAIPHMTIFLAFLVLSTWFNMPLGLGLVTLTFSQGIMSWQDFQEDLSIPLGEDDRMSVYWVLKRYAVGEGCWGLRKADDGYFITAEFDGGDAEED